ncbi:MAG TPA: PH domain-containing protein [Clostridiales bacterium]|nr:MAG: Bacterial membrane flanked domain protein [Firmicutes bacterium ADurb.Bin262]HOU09620.1 PH domain-containing protein [Clostridiales bacterium]HQH63202.1 PH domain-containing protein [Clostridiales bacterium]HQK74457.1 PH domain-containing protein [Clostridiales bacterium]
MTYERLSKKALRLMRITCAMLLLLYLLAAGAAAAYLYLAGRTAACVALAVCAPAAAAAVFFIVPPLRHRRYRYHIGRDRIEIIEGLLFIRRTIIPVDRIYQIDIRRGPLDNLTGVAKVVVTTAGSAAAFRFLEPEKAEEIALYLNETVTGKIRAEAPDDV